MTKYPLRLQENPHGWNEATGETVNCPHFCEVFCEENEMHCPGGYDDNWCQMPSTCEVYGFETPNGENYCMNHCPATCYPGEMPCPGGVDHWTGCPMPDYCISSKSWDGHWDFATETWIDCPNHCEPNCNWESEMHCPGVMDESGCHGPASCIPNNNVITNADGTETWCMPHCPVSCYPEEQVCPGQTWVNSF